MGSRQRRLKDTDHENFLNACENLIGCYNKDLIFDDERRMKSYRLRNDHLAIPIKRIPGLALPDGNHLWNKEPIPLHLYDFAMHMYHNWNNPEALMFYVPKLENEGEARYLRNMISESERMIKEIHPEYKIGSVGLFIVFENREPSFALKKWLWN